MSSLDQSTSETLEHARAGIGVGEARQSASSDIRALIEAYADPTRPAPRGRHLTPHLRRLEAEAIYILREVAVQFRNPVMMYSVGKDSTAMLHLARKAFWPGSLPFPLLHVATGWDFADVLVMRDLVAAALGLRLVVHTNEDGVARGINPIVSEPGVHAHVMSTEALKQALGRGRFDAAIGGARRDEEASRAKERIFSFRTAAHTWDPRQQRPELWNIYNGRVSAGESVRVFPLSNWTELDVWTYIRAENIPVVPLYFAVPRPVVRRSGTLLLINDERLPVEPGEIEMREVRFRTLGCYPLTGGMESQARDIDEIIAEMLASRLSERQGRLIDHDSSASMERKKREGYF